MHFIMADVAKGDKVLNGVLATLCMVFNMVEFEEGAVAVCLIRLFKAPTAAATTVVVSFKHLDTNRIGNFPVMHFCLAVFFE